MSTTVTTSSFRTRSAEIIGRVTFGGEVITISKNGKAVAALISMKDYARLKKIEDAQDVRDADAAVAEGGKPTSLDDLKKELKL